MIRAPRQIARWPRRRIANRSARNGSFRQTASTDTLCKSSARRAPGASRCFAARGSCARQQAQQIRGQRRELCRAFAVLRMYDDVPSCGYLLAVATHDFPHAPPDAIAHHRAAEGLLDAEAEAAAGQLIRAKKNGEVGTRAAFPGAVHHVKLSAPHQPRFTRKAQASRAIRE